MMFERKSAEYGFTLIEILVVVALVGFISALALPSISSYLRVSTKTATREIATTIKDTYNATIVRGQVHRIVYDLKTSEYWAEEGPKEFLLHTEESREAEERANRFKDEDERPKEPFKIATTVTRKKKQLPRGVRFEDIVSEQFDEPVTEGLAYTHIFPHGIIEQTIIHIIDKSEHQTSLIVASLNGKTQVMQEYVKKDEIFGK